MKTNQKLDIFLNNFINVCNINKNVKTNDHFLLYLNKNIYVELLNSCEFYFDLFKNNESILVSPLAIFFNVVDITNNTPENIENRINASFNNKYDFEIGARNFVKFGITAYNNNLIYFQNNCDLASYQIIYPFNTGCYNIILSFLEKHKISIDKMSENLEIVLLTKI